MKTKLPYLILILVFSSHQVWSQEIEKDGIRYLINGLEATVIAKTPSYDGDIVIPDSFYDDGTHQTYSVTEIGDNAFDDCQELTNVSVPEGVWSIGFRAFRGCSALQEIIIPESVVRIGEQAYLDSGAMEGELSTIYIPDGVMEIGALAFSSVTTSSFVVGNGNMSYSSEGGVLFDKWKSTLIAYPIQNDRQEYEIPQDVIRIEMLAFLFAKNITKLTITNSLQEIGYDAFWGCDELISFDVDPMSPYYASVDGALYDKEVTTLIAYPSGKTGDCVIPNTVKTIKKHAFAHLYTRAPSIYIPFSVEVIEEVRDFGYSSYLESIVVDESNPNYSSDNGVLFDKEKKTLFVHPQNKSGHYIIPISTNMIKNSAFQGSYNLFSVTIPAEVSSIGLLSFYACSRLTHIYVKGTTPAECGIYGSSTPFSGIYKTATVHVPAGSKRFYEEADGWKDFENIVEGHGMIVGVESSSSVKLEWSAIADAVRYTLILYNDEDLTQENSRYQLDEEGNENLRSTATETLSYTIEGLGQGQSIYYYSLTAYDNEDQAITAHNGYFTMVSTSIPETTSENNMHAIYDPSTSNLQILSSDTSIENVELFTLAGRKIIDTKERMIQIGNLSDGVYILQIKTEKGIYTQKVVK